VNEINPQDSQISI